MIALLVSLGMLLFAAAGVARHIWRHRSLMRRQSGTAELTGETEIETES
ncbi:MAG TPA: hypothetical protein VGR47_17465 [Terracidiphilus sp.]|nr:hypothetical protein [Terracidiphilus sp.]